MGYNPWSSARPVEIVQNPGRMYNGGRPAMPSFFNPQANIFSSGMLSVYPLDVTDISYPGCEYVGKKKNFVIL